VSNAQANANASLLSEKVSCVCRERAFCHNRCCQTTANGPRFSAFGGLSSLCATNAKLAKSAGLPSFFFGRRRPPHQMRTKPDSSKHVHLV
jgi:hypothetical protein